MAPSPIMPKRRNGSPKNNTPQRKGITIADCPTVHATAPAIMAFCRHNMPHGTDKGSGRYIVTFFDRSKAADDGKHQLLHVQACQSPRDSTLQPPMRSTQCALPVRVRDLISGFAPTPCAIAFTLDYSFKDKSRWVCGRIG